MKITPYTPIQQLRWFVKLTYLSQVAAAFFGAAMLQTVWWVYDGFWFILSAAHGLWWLITLSLGVISMFLAGRAAYFCMMMFVSSASARVEIRHLIRLKQQAGLR